MSFTTNVYYTDNYSGSAVSGAMTTAMTAITEPGIYKLDVYAFSNDETAIGETEQAHAITINQTIGVVLTEMFHEVFHTTPGHSLQVLLAFRDTIEFTVAEPQATGIQISWTGVALSNYSFRLHVWRVA